MHLLRELKVHSFSKCTRKEVNHKVVNIKHAWDTRSFVSKFYFISCWTNIWYEETSKQKCNAYRSMITCYNAQDTHDNIMMKIYSLFALKKKQKIFWNELDVYLYSNRILKYSLWKTIIEFLNARVINHLFLMLLNIDI